MQRPVFDVFDCSFAPDCFLLQFSLFLCCSSRRYKRSPADVSERPANKLGCRAGSPTPGQLRPGQDAHIGRLQHPSPSPGAREAGFFSLVRTAVASLYQPCCRANSEQKQKRAKQELSQSIYNCTRLRPFRKWSRNFAQIPFRSTVWSTVSESIFGTHTQTPQHSVQKFPSNGMQNLPLTPSFRSTFTFTCEKHSVMALHQGNVATAQWSKKQRLCKRNMRGLPQNQHVRACLKQQKAAGPGLKWRTDVPFAS